MVPLGLRIACRRATCPTKRSPCSVKATTEGVVRAPSELGITVGWPPSTAAMTELVVPRSIPTAFAMVSLLTGSCSRRGAGGAGDPLGLVRHGLVHQHLVPARREAGLRGEVAAPAHERVGDQGEADADDGAERHPVEEDRQE